MQEIKIDEKSSVSIFQQIVDGIERLILTCDLQPEDFISSVREFATKHAVNPNTVAKAYALLQARGLVEPVRGMGLRVIKQTSAALSRRRQELLHESARSAVDEAAALGFSKSDLISAIEDIKPHRRKE